MKEIRIVSLSSGVLGEDFVAHELPLGQARLEARGYQVTYGKNALNGMEDLQAHPQKRAQDLMDAFTDPKVDVIMTAVGGDDTFRLTPYLMDQGQVAQALRSKIFLGFSDTTVNHLLLGQLGLITFYGQAFLPDVCELDRDLLPYSARYVDELLATGQIQELRPSPIWYQERTSFGPDQLGVPRPSFANEDWKLLQGPASFHGPIMGGCLESLADLLMGSRHPEEAQVNREYGIFPSLDQWQGKILLLETSEEQISPDAYRRALEVLKETGIFGVIKGILVGKPQDNRHYEAYQEVLLEVVEDKDLPILVNLPIGHCLPRAILPLGVEARVDAKEQVITFDWTGIEGYFKKVD